MERSKTQVLGLTGGIASGKSLVGQFFREAGVPVIDADQLVRVLSAPGGAAYTAIETRFRTHDRRALRDLIFSDPVARRDLQNILHPLLPGALADELSRLGHPPLAIYEAALIIEAGRASDFDGLIVVTSPRATRIERVMKRDGETPEGAERILASQLSDDERLLHATFQLENNSNAEDLRAAVLELIRKIRLRA